MVREKIFGGLASLKGKWLKYLADVAEAFPADKVAKKVEKAAAEAGEEIVHEAAETAVKTATEISPSVATNSYKKYLIGGGIAIGTALGYGGYKSLTREVETPMMQPIAGGASAETNIAGTEYLCDRKYEAEFANAAQNVINSIGRSAFVDLVDLIIKIVYGPPGGSKIDKCEATYLNSVIASSRLEAAQAWVSLCSESHEINSATDFTKMIEIAALLKNNKKMNSVDPGSTSKVTDKKESHVEVNPSENKIDPKDINIDPEKVDVKKGEIDIKPVTTQGVDREKLRTVVIDLAGVHKKVFDDNIFIRHFNECLKASEPLSYKPDPNSVISSQLIEKGVKGLFVIEMEKAIKSFQDIKVKAPEVAVSDSKSVWDKDGHKMVGFVGANDTLALIDSIYGKGKVLTNEARGTFLAALILDNNILPKIDLAEFPKRGISIALIGRTILLRNLKGARFSQSDYERLKTQINSKTRSDFFAYWKNKAKDHISTVLPRSVNTAFEIDEQGRMLPGSEVSFSSGAEGSEEVYYGS